MNIKSLAFVLIFCILLNGCGRNNDLSETSTSTEVNSTESRLEIFLTNLFTSNYDNRYSTLKESSDPDAASSYYDSLTEYTTDSCRESLASNRIPYKYDKMAFDGKYDVKVKKISLTYNDSQKLYDFEVFLDITGEGDAPFSSISGQLGLEDGEQDALINYVYIRI